jgi:putative Mg2+ transporter-C (MgtC) family protein
VLGGIVGLQRQAAGKPAGFRTHLIVAAGAAAFTAIGAHLHDTRIPSYIVVGIGFLGGGAIVHRNNWTRGLTTAASIWMVAAVGLAMGYSSGFGLYVALLSTVLTLITLGISDARLLSAFHIPRKMTITVTYEDGSDVAERIEGAIRRGGARINASEVTCVRTEEGVHLVDAAFYVEVPDDRDLTGPLMEIGTIARVRRAESAESSFGDSRS